MAKKRTKKLAAAAAVCGLCVAMGAWSHDARADEQVILPEIKVTANKVVENVQAVPQSVSVLSEDDVRDAGIANLDDLSARAPNLTMPTGGMSMMKFPSIRGSQSIAHSYVTSVVTYIDDVPLTNTTAYDWPLYNIESIEVLRGPQGTLYGRNAQGGVIKVTTKKPTNEFHGHIGVEVGTHNHVKPSISLSGPLVKDTLYANGSFQFYNHRGNVWNDYAGTYSDKRRNYSGRLGLTFTPNEDWEIRLSGGLTKYDEGGFSMYSPNAYAIYDPLYGSAMTQMFHDMNGGTRQLRHVNSNDNGYNKTSLNDQVLTIKYNISPEWTFQSITTRSESNIKFDVDYDFGPNMLAAMGMPGMSMEDRNDSGMYDFGQEFRFTYDDGSMNAILGAAYSHVDRRVRYDYYTSIGATSARDVTNTYSLFGQVKLPFAERWALTVGGRADYYHTGSWKKGSMMSSGYSGDDSWFNFSPKVALEYNITDHNMLYASFSEGYKSGGFDSAYATPGHEKYDKEHVYSFEIGSKNQFLDNKLRINLAGFANKYNGMQVEKYTAGMQGYIDNAGNPWALGVEGEIAYMILPGLEIFANAGYTHLRFDDINDDLYGPLKDNHVPYVPSWTYSFGASYKHKSGFYARMDATGATKSYLNINNNGYIPSHTLFNARVGYEVKGFDIYAYVNNIFDKNYDYVRSFGGAYWVATEGVNGGVGVSYRF